MRMMTMPFLKYRAVALADLEQVFVRFALLSNRPTDGEAQGRSSLAKAREMALAQNGSLVARSDGTGCGCTFTLGVPLVL